MVKSAKVCLAIPTFWCWHRPFRAFLSGGTPVIIQVDRILVLNLHQWWRFPDPSIPFNSDGRIPKSSLHTQHFPSIFPAFSWVKSPFYPLVICYIAMERSTIFHGKIRYKSPCLMGKSTISMAIFNSKLFLHRPAQWWTSPRCSHWDTPWRGAGHRRPPSAGVGRSWLW